MALKQVGIAALRSPTGEFLPAVPIMKEVPETSKVAEITNEELERLFIERMKQYAHALDEQKKGVKT